MDRDMILYDVWLSGRIHAGSRAYEKLFDYYSSAYEIFRAEKDELERIGISERLLTSLCNKDLRLAEQGVDFCLKKDVKIVLRGEKNYPSKMESIPNPPYAIFVKGDISKIDRKLCVAIVGTRSMSEYGMNTAYKISYELAAAGVTVVSGMALGVDSVAAVGALEAGGDTVAVLGCGLDKVYPPSHRKLMGIIAERGTLVSEYPPGTPPVGSHFPVRNRIISGLSTGTLIIEAGEGSGAMLTARETIRQGRDIFAVPGNVDSENTAGTNRLIRDGARVVLTARDIIDEYKKEYSRQIDKNALADAARYSDCSISVLSAYGVAPAYSLRAVNITPADDTAQEETGTGEKLKFKKVRKLIKYRKRPADEKTVSNVSSQQINNEPPADELQRMVYDMMPIGKAVPEDYFAPLGLESGDLILQLAMLEMSGYVTVIPGGTYRREF